MVNLDEISNRLSEKFGVTKKDSKIFTEAVFDEIFNILTNEHEEVRIKNFGSFNFGKVAARSTKHPRTKENIHINSNVTIRFKTSTKLKHAIHESCKYKDE